MTVLCDDDKKNLENKDLYCGVNNRTSVNTTYI